MNKQYFLAAFLIEVTDAASIATHARFSIDRDDPKQKHRDPKKCMDTIARQFFGPENKPTVAQGFTPTYWFYDGSIGVEAVECEEVIEAAFDVMLMITDLTDLAHTYPPSLAEIEPDHEAIAQHMRRAIEAWPQFDGEKEVSGADMVEWFDTWRRDAKRLLNGGKRDPDMPAVPPEGPEVKVVIIMKDGLIIEVLADGPDVDIGVIDYDIQGYDAEQLTNVPHCSPEDQAVVRFEERHVKPARVAELWKIIKKATRAT